MKIKTRIAINFAMITSIILLVLGISVYTLLKKYTQREFTERLHERCVIVAQNYLEQDELSQQLLKDLRQQHLRTLPYEREYFFRLESRDSMLAHLPDYISAGVEKGLKPEARYFSVGLADTLGAGIIYDDNEGTFYTIITAVDQYGQNKLQQLGRILLGLGGVFLLSILFVGRWYARQVLLPLTEMTEKIKTVNSANLHIRLATPPGSDAEDEIGSIVKAFNKMLTRLETSVEVQRNFITHASHQLKTPLTTILGEVEFVLGQRQQLEPAVAEALGHIEEEAERLNKLTLRLLHLAEVGAAGGQLVVGRVRMDELLFEVQASLLKQWPNRRLLMDTASFPDESDDWEIQADGSLLKIALSNLIDNALKYSDEAVRLSFAFSPEEIAITIKDEGIGIRPEEEEAIFTPFFRGKNAQHRSGYGVGLPLAQKIIALHQGRLWLTAASPRGTWAELALPRQLQF